MDLSKCSKEDLIKEIERLQKEHVQLQTDSDFLGRLMAAGVDNWEGYEYACG